MNCTNHPKVEANATCIGCGNFFCNDCLVKVKGKNYCKECVAEQLEKKAAKENEVANTPSTVQPQIVIQQQQQQQQQAPVAPESGKPRGSWCWLVFWIIVFFPIAILYALMRRWD